MTRTNDALEEVRPPSSRRAAIGPAARASVVSKVLAVLAVVAFTAAGVFAGSQAPVRYTSEVRLSVGQNSLKTLSVPGYVQATQQLAGIYARYVNTGALGLDELGARLGLPPGALVSAIASPIADSNIVRIQVAGTSYQSTTQAAGALADALVTQVNAPPDDRTEQKKALLRASRESADAQQAVSDAEAELAAVLEQYRRQHPGGSALEQPTSPEIDQAKATLAEARSAYTLAQISAQEASDDYRSAAPDDLENVGLQVVSPAAASDDTRSRSLQWGGIGGLTVGLLLGFLMVSSSARRRRRRG
jgi:type II secretory pathway pseudopilin PulG